LKPSTSTTTTTTTTTGTGHQVSQRFGHGEDVAPALLLVRAFGEVHGAAGVLREKWS